MHAQAILKKATAGQLWPVELPKADGSYVNAATGVTAKRIVDGAAQENLQGSLAANGDNLIFTTHANDVGDVTIWTFDHVDATERQTVYVVSHDKIADLLFQGSVKSRSLNGLALAQLQWRDALQVALIQYLGTQTPDNIAAAIPNISVTYPGDATEIYNYPLYTTVNDAVIDRGPKRDAARPIGIRSLSGVTAPTRDDALVAAMCAAVRKMTWTGTSIVVYQPDNTSILQNLTVNVSPPAGAVTSRT